MGASGKSENYLTEYGKSKFEKVYFSQISLKKPHDDRRKHPGFDSGMYIQKE